MAQKKIPKTDMAKVVQKKTHGDKEAFGPKLTNIPEKGGKISRKAYEKDTGVFNQ